MKKHPVIKYILILIISGSCGALASRIFRNFEDGVIGAIKNFSEWFGSMTPALHISICLFLSLMSVYSIHKLKKLLNSITPENEDEIYDQIENQSNPGMMCSVLCTISNFFFLGASTAYLIPKNILISAVATIVFLSINTWVEVSQVNLIKKINPKFKNTDPMSMRFMKDWEKESDEVLDFYSGEEVMSLFKVKQSWLYTSAKRNHIPICRIAGKNYYSKKHVDEFFGVAVDMESITDWLLTEEAEELFGMKPAALRAYAYRHRIPTKREYGRTYYSKSHLDELRRTDLVNDERYYTVEQVRQIYGLSSANICHIVKVKHIEKIKVGVKNLLLRSDVERVMAERNK